MRILPVLNLEAYSTPAKRVEARAELNGRLEAELRARPTAEWVAIFRDAGVPAAPIIDTRQVIDDPRYRERAVTRSVAGGEIRGSPFPALADGFSTRLARPPIEAGADTRAVLREFGFSQADVEALQATGVVD